MGHKIKIAPSILASDFARLAEQVQAAQAAGADYIHVDVMDGHFVPNITIGAPVVRCLRRVTDLPLDVHLMVSDPIKHIPSFTDAGADYLYIHVEATPHLHHALQTIRDAGAHPGVTMNPGTPACTISEIIKDVDAVLIMTVSPGWGGQTFIANTLNKVTQVRRLLDGVNNQADIEVDGGIDSQTAELAAAAGANVMVAGTSIFQAPEGIAAAIKAIRGAAERGRAKTSDG